MNKEIFLQELRRRLPGLPKKEIEERVAFYSEMIDDRVEDGISEEEAVADIGGVDTVIAEIMEEVPLSMLVKEKVRPKRSLRVWEIILLVLGSPLWLCFLICFLAVVLAVGIALFSVLLSVYIVEFTLATTALLFPLLMAIAYFQAGNPAAGMFSIGAGLILAGLAIFLMIGCIHLTRAVFRLCRKALTGIKTSLARRRNTHHE